MKLQFEAIDGKGRVVRGILRAESEEDARDLLMAEEIYAKRLIPCPEEATPTWAPKVRARSSRPVPEAERLPVRHVLQTALREAGAAPQPGRLGLTESGEAVVFEPASGDPRRWTIDEIEVATVHGLIVRELTITLNNGRSLVFDGGTVFAASEAGSLAKHIQSRKRKT